MKALSLIQPWASLVAIGAKQIETRSWKTLYRGTLAIHAAKGFPCHGPEQMGVIVAVCELTAVHRIPLQPQHFARFDVPTQHRLSSYPVILPPLEWREGFGHSHEFDFGDYTAGRFAWILTDVCALKEPIVCKGALGLWDVPANVESLIREQLQNG